MSRLLRAFSARPHREPRPLLLRAAAALRASRALVVAAAPRMARSIVVVASPRVVRALVVAAALLVPAAGVVGCAAEAPSRVEQSDPVATGNPAYDDFFKQVQATHDEAEEAKKTAADARQPLVKALELDPKEASFDAIVDQMTDRSKKLRERGFTLHLDLLPDPKLTTTPNKPLDPWGEDTLRAVEESAKKSLALVRKMTDLSGRVSALQKKRIELLEGVSTALGAQARDVARELDASDAVLSNTASLSAKQAGVASRFLIAVADVLETGGSSSAAPSKPSSSRAASGGGGRGGGRGGGGKPAAKPPAASGGSTSAAPAPAPKPKPKSDDFEP